MRYKDKIYCDCCGKELETLNKGEMGIILSNLKNGTRVNCGRVCNECATSNEETLEAKKKLSELREASQLSPKTKENLK